MWQCHRSESANVGGGVEFGLLMYPVTFSIGGSLAAGFSVGLASIHVG